MSFVVPSELIALAHKLADAAGEVIRPYYRADDLHIEVKDDISPLVTLADRNAEKSIRELIHTHRPQDGIWGEEFGQEKIDAEYVWILDPVDGTTPFTLGRPTFGTLIGLYHKTEGFVYGIADQPITRDRWAGGIGVGVTRNGKNVKASRNNVLEKLRVTVTNPLRFTPVFQKLHDKVVKPKALFMHYGGDFLNFVGVCDGNVDVSFDSCQAIYDIAAIIPMITEAGGIVTFADGSPIALFDGKRDILAACTSELHKALLKAYSAA